MRACVAVALLSLLLASGAAAQDARLAQLVTKANALQPWMVGIRRRLHQTPELLYNLPSTTALVRAELTSMGIPFKFPVGVSGIVAEIGSGAPIVALRADMDALPIPEASGVPFASTNGLSHACGHDVHTTMLLGAAKLLKGMEAQIKGTVRLLFTPAEEGGAGCHLMVKAGAVDGVGAAFGFHVAPWIPTGTIQTVTTGQAMMGAAAWFDMNVTGVGGHGALPHLARDPVPAAAAIISAFQTIVSRETDPMAASVVSVTKLAGSAATNIIPESVRMGGTVRATTLEGIQTVMKRMQEMAPAVATGHRTSANVAFLKPVDDVTVYPPTICNPATAKFALDVARRMTGDTAGRRVNEAAPVMAAEDFSYIAQRVPSAFMFLGIRNERVGSVHNLHTPQFKVDEDVMKLGAALHASLATEWLAANQPGGVNKTASAAPARRLLK